MADYLKIKTLFLVCLIMPSIFLSFTPKAHAQFAAVVTDPTHTKINAAEWIRKYGKEVIEAAAMNAAKRALQEIVNSSIEWAQTGFEGNPAYVTNPRQYFTNIADGVAGEFIEGTSLGFLCSPFRAQVRLALRQQYIGPERPFQCTLSEIVGNIEGFYGDFSQGGWDAWFSMTQNPQNNPYGAYLEAKLELDSRLAQAIGLADQQLSWNQGFLSWADCTKTNPPALIEVQDPVFGTIRQTNPGHVRGIPVGGCIERGDTKTPGSVIAAQLNQVLPAGMQSLITADTWEKLIEAFATGILRRYVFGEEGLFASGNSVAPQIPGSNRPSPTTITRIDLDGDGVDDGLDTTGDGNPDFCYFGGVDTISGPPCVPSSEFTGGVRPPTSFGFGNDIPNPPPIATNFSNVVWADTNISSWTEIGGLSVSVSSPAFSGSNITLNHDGIYNWPDGFPLDSSTALNANTWIFVYRNGRWVASTWEWMRPGQTEKDTSNLYAPGNALRGDLSNSAARPFAPQTGDVYGFMVSCLARNSTRNCEERSNVVMVTWPFSSGGGTSPRPPGGGGGPSISSVSPVTVSPGQSISIFGSNLTTTVQFLVGTQTYTVSGSINGSATQVSVQTPSSIPQGSASVRIYRDASTQSNSVSITISGTQQDPIPTIQPVSSWTPSQTINGWWPNLSPDGRYVSYGNWGESWVTDLQTGEVWDFRNPPGSGPTEVCRGGWWIMPNVLTFTCYGESGSSEDRHARYQVNVGTWTPIRMSDDPALVAGNQFVAVDGNWASRLGLRLVRNGQVLSTNAGGAISMSGNTLVHACTNENTSICVREGGVISRTYIPQVPLFDTATRNGYVIYGGFGPVRGITPLGSDINLRLSNSINEGVQDVVMVGATPWVLTTGWNNAGNNYIFLRPWGSSSTIAVSANAVHARVVVVGDNFVIAYNNDRGGLAVITVPINSERSTIN